MAYYLEDGDTIFLTITESDLKMTIGLTEDSNSFFWSGETDDYEMSGMCKASSISQDTTTISYEETTAPYYLRSIFNQNCVLVIQLLLIYADRNFESIDVSMADFGFTNYQ